MNRYRFLLSLCITAIAGFAASCVGTGARVARPETPSTRREHGADPAAAERFGALEKQTTAPTTAPTTRPTTGPTEQSAAGVEAPPAPPLSPADSMKSFRIAPGFRVELVAAEPLIQDPVVISFDADGRMWAVEMTTYMPDAYGTGEKAPRGKIVILDDTDGDGRMDKRSVWLDGLVLPRAVLPLRDGALVATPPYLKFYRDTNGDGRADTEQLVTSDYGNPKMNPEHQANGLLIGLDNWIYSVNHNARFRWLLDDDAAAKGDKGAVKWISSRLPSRGQWGQSMDDIGRLYHDSNSDYLRADLVPPHYFPNRNPHYAGQSGVNVQLDKDQTVWPIRPTPAVNRGYRKGFLRADGSLKEFTAACGPCVYRGGIFPPDCDGDVFVCEPSAHLIRRADVTDDGATLMANNAYDRAEFLAATDERFRPVNIHVGPDGALYVVDLYRGILQHVYYLTGYLRELHLRRNMELPIHMGRIYRVVHETSRLRKIQKLSSLSSMELVERLGDRNGWVRDTAQRLLVERRDRLVARALRETVSRAASKSRTGVRRLDELAVIHALWTLDGLNAVDRPTLLRALTLNERMLPTSVRLTERLLAGQAPDRPPTEILRQLLAIAHSATDPKVRFQLAFTLSAVDHPLATDAVAGLLATSPGDKILRDAALSGLAGRELATLDTLLGNGPFSIKAPGADATLAALAGAVLREGNPARVERLMQLAVGRDDASRWQQIALLTGMADVASKAKASAAAARVVFAAVPESFLSLAESADANVAKRAEAIYPVLHWPGKTDERHDAAPPLTAAQQARFDNGKMLFAATCAACHQAGGEGLDGKAPALRGSPWVAGSKGRLIRIVLNGVRGPIHVGDEVINMEMPNLAALDDEQVAAVLTYARREWGGAADPVDPEIVAKIRAEVKGRPDAWTEEELLKIE